MFEHFVFPGETAGLYQAQMIQSSGSLNWYQANLTLANVTKDEAEKNIYLHLNIYTF